MKPKYVNKSKQNALFGHRLAEYPLLKYKLGDTVRISQYKSTLKKGYEANFMQELFRIVKVIRGDPNVYELEDLEGETIIGKFYEQELSGVDKKDDVYKIGKY